VDHVIKTIFRLLLRAVLWLLGLVFLASLLAASLVLLALWLLRALWARLSGRPVAPLVFRFGPQAQWRRFYQAAAGRTTPQDVVDVEAVVIDVAPRAIHPPGSRTDG
jgi:hypothetical protein